MKRYMYVSIFAIGCVSIHSMLLDVLALYVGDLQVEVFPITGVPNRGGKTTHLGGVRKSKKIQMYSDRCKSLVEYGDDVYSCNAYAGICYVL